MNIELKPRRELFPAPVSTPANDNVERWNQPARRRRVLIYKPAKSSMTSGRAGTKQWLLEYKPQSAPFIEPLMGWTGSTDPMAHLRLSFPSREAAVAYAERQGLPILLTLSVVRVFGTTGWIKLREVLAHRVGDVMRPAAGAASGG